MTPRLRELVANATTRVTPGNWYPTFIEGDDTTAGRIEFPNRTVSGLIGDDRACELICYLVNHAELLASVVEAAELCFELADAHPADMAAYEEAGHKLRAALAALKAVGT